MGIEASMAFTGVVGARPDAPLASTIGKERTEAAGRAGVARGAEQYYWNADGETAIQDGHDRCY